MNVKGIALNNDINTVMTKAQADKAEQLKKNLETGSKSGEDKDLKKVAQDFESIFINMMLKTMRSTVVEGGFIEKSFGTKAYESMLDEEMSKEMSKSGGLGIAEMVYKSLVRRSEMESDGGVDSLSGAATVEDESSKELSKDKIDDSEN